MDSPVRIDIRPVWRFRAKREREFDLTLLALLEAIEHDGKLTVAARKAGISYRHAWNLIEDWAGLFGAPLVQMERGRGTRLSALGAKLLWAGKRAQARLAPEFENLASEFASALNDSIARSEPTLHVHASHDFAVAKLRDMAAAAGGCAIDLRYRGSAEALASLRRGSCDLAGFHISEGALGTRTAVRYAESLRPRVHRLVWMATRVQGMIVRPGNPKQIWQVADLAREGVRIINRQRDSGTRILLDQMLSMSGIDPSALTGYENEEFTHAAIAAHVASGLADVGLGIEAAAAQFGLDFVPLASERYFFAAHKDVLQRPAAAAFLAALRSAEVRAMIDALPGYRAERSGEVTPLQDTPPWNELLAKPPAGA